MTQQVSPRIDNITWAFTEAGLFHTEADYNFPGTSQEPRHVTHDVPTYAYEYFLALASKLTPDNLAGNVNADGTVKQPSDPGYTTTPAEADAARIIHDYNWITYAPAPATGGNIKSGTAPAVA